VAIRTLIVLTFALALAAAFARADALDPKAADAVVALKDVSVNGGAVSGAIENQGSLPVKDVTLSIQHRYRWPNEYKPGAVDPGRAEKTTLSETIPPGGRATFRHDGGPLEAPDKAGSFETTVTVLSFVVIEPPAP
jgi:hypothetical protein